MTDHPQTMLDGAGFQCDSKLAHLLAAFHRRGVATLFSCQGYGEDYGSGRAYIVFRHTSDAEEAIRLVVERALLVGDTDLAIRACSRPSAPFGPRGAWLWAEPGKPAWELQTKWLEGGPGSPTWLDGLRLTVHLYMPSCDVDILDEMFAGY